MEENSHRSTDRRRCRRCGAYLSAANTDRTCFPCQRADLEATWATGRRLDRPYGGGRSDSR